MDSQVKDTKERVARAVRIITAGKLWPLTKGHVSGRVPGTDQICILGHIHSEGRTLDTVTVEDITMVDLDGMQLDAGPNPPGERFIHTEIYRVRPEVMSVIHNHSPYAVAFGIAGRPLIPVGNRGGIFGPSVPVLDFDGQIETQELGKLVADAIGSNYSVILRNHGTASVGATIEDAVVTAFALEETAELLWRAIQLGAPVPISDREQRDIREGPRVKEREFFTHYWPHYAVMDPFLKKQL